jgi:hypothetical protein
VENKKCFDTVDARYKHEDYNNYKKIITQEDLKSKYVRNWRGYSQDREQWRAVL